MTASRSPRTAPATTDVADRLRLAVTRLQRRLRQQSADELTLTQLSTLASVRRHGPLTLGELAAQERVAPPTVTKVIGKLEQHGFVTRAIDPGDRRVTRVAVTAEGEAHLARVRNLRTAWLATRLDALSPADLTRVVDALDVLESLSLDDPT